VDRPSARDKRGDGDLVEMNGTEEGVRQPNEKNETWEVLTRDVDVWLPSVFIFYFL